MYTQSTNYLPEISRTTFQWIHKRPDPVFLDVNTLLQGLVQFGQNPERRLNKNITYLTYSSVETYRSTQINRENLLLSRIKNKNITKYYRWLTWWHSIFFRLSSTFGFSQIYRCQRWIASGCRTFLPSNRLPEWIRWRSENRKDIPILLLLYGRRRIVVAIILLLLWWYFWWLLRSSYLRSGCVRFPCLSRVPRLSASSYSFSDIGLVL